LDFFCIFFGNFGNFWNIWKFLEFLDFFLNFCFLNYFYYLQFYNIQMPRCREDDAANWSAIVYFSIAACPVKLDPSATFLPSRPGDTIYGTLQRQSTLDCRYLTLLCYNFLQNFFSLHYFVLYVFPVIHIIPLFYSQTISLWTEK
jgi:hypothetical protein